MRKNALPLFACLILMIMGCNFSETNDPFGCKSESKFLVQDTTLPDGVVGEYYSEKIRKNCLVKLIDSAKADSLGLKLALDSSDYYIQGVPKFQTESSYALTIREGECATQCIGSEADYSIFIKINPARK